MLYIHILPFQSTLPARGATAGYPSYRSSTVFQSTLPARGATKIRTDIKDADYIISIHAPRTGSDKHPIRFINSTDDFNPRSPHGERPVRPHVYRQGVGDFNPRSPHGERHAYLSRLLNLTPISIHAPRTGSDGTPDDDRCTVAAISIHAPRTGSDVYATRYSIQNWISIHAPRTGSDLQPAGRSAGHGDFNPRSPHGERHSPPNESWSRNQPFQSTLPARGATPTV